MRIPRIAGLLVILGGLYAAGTCPADATTNRIRDLMAQIEGIDDELRERAVGRLIEIGPAALPHLEKRLNTKWRPDYQEIIDRIQAREALRAKEAKEAAKHATKIDKEKLLRDNWPAFMNRFARKKIERIEDLARAGEHTQAIALIDALLLIEPGLRARLKQELAVLRKKCKADRFATQAIQGRVEVDRKVYEFGQEIKLTFAVTNNAAAKFVIKNKGLVKRGGEEVEQHSLVHITYRVFDYSLDGRVQAQIKTAEVKIMKDIVLDKGATWRMSWTIPKLPASSRDTIYRELHVDAKAIPLGMRVAVVQHDQTKLAFPVQTFRVFPVNYDKLAPKPLVALRNGLRQNRRDEVFVATLLVPAHKHREAVGMLVDDLANQTASMTATTLALLQILTGKKNIRDADTWELWWASNKERWKPRARW